MTVKKAISYLTSRNHFTSRSERMQELSKDFDIIYLDDIHSIDRRKEIYQLRKQGYTVLPKINKYDYSITAIKPKQQDETVN